MTKVSTLTIPGPDGFELAYCVRGKGAPLLLLHGFFGAGEDFAHLFDLAALARERTLVIPDLRGHGASTNPGADLTHRQCAVDMLALLDHLGLPRVDALGHSLGGNTLLHLATRAPDRVGTMVLAGAPSYFPGQARAIMRAVGDEARGDAEWAVLRAKHRHGDAQIRALSRIARGFAERHDDMAFTPPLLATIRARTLIVAGDRDELYPLEIFVEQYRSIAGAQLCVLPGGGHDAVFTGGRGAFTRAALAFLGVSAAAARP